MVHVILFAGLGNRLFQLAAMYGISKETDTQCKIAIVCGEPTHDIDSKKYDFIYKRFAGNSKCTITHIPTMQVPQIIKECDAKRLNLVSQPGFASDFHAFNPSDFTDSSVIFGYFQNERYFEKYRDDLLQILTEPSEGVVGNGINSYLSRHPMIDFGKMYFIHIRMGDYMYPANRKIHYVNLVEYYLKAIAHIQSIDPGAKFVLFTDSVNAYSKLYPYVERCVDHIVDEKDAAISLYLMIRCKKGGICANSTFSWWGAWLNANPEKIIIVPSQWFNNESTYHRGHVVGMNGSTIIDVL